MASFCASAAGELAGTSPPEELIPVPKICCDNPISAIQCQEKCHVGLTVAYILSLSFMAVQSGFSTITTAPSPREKLPNNDKTQS